MACSALQMLFSFTSYWLEEGSAYPIVSISNQLIKQTIKQTNVKANQTKKVGAKRVSTTTSTKYTYLWLKV